MRQWESMLAKRPSPAVVIAVAVFVGSTSAILIRFSEAPSLVKVFYRLCFTTAIVAPLAIRDHRDAFRSLSSRDAALSAVTGVVVGVHFIFFFESLEWTTVAATVTLAQTHAVFVPLGAYFVLNERITGRMTAGIAVAFGGVALLSTGGVLVSSLLTGPAPVYGNVLAVLAGLMFACYLLAGRSIRQRLPVLPYVTVVYAFATATVFAIAGVNGSPIVAAYPPREWILFVAMAIGPGVTTHLLINWALEFVDSSVVSVSFLAVPALSTVLAVVFLTEVPDPFTVVGAALVLFGIYVTTTAEGDPTAPSPADD